MNSPKRLLNKKRIELQFDLAAARYDQFAEVQREMADDILLAAQRTNPGPESQMMDLGCGTGELLARLHQAGWRRQTGLDLSQNMLQGAASRCPEANFLHADMEAIPMDDAAVNLIVSNAAVQWCDIEAAASEMFRILAPGGKAIVGTFTDGTLRQWVQAFATSRPSRIHPFLHSSTIAAAFRQAGFEDLKLSKKVRTATFDSIKSMFRSVQRLGATNAMESGNQPITRKQYAALIEHFDAVLQRDGKLCLDYACLHVEANKP